MEAETDAPPVSLHTYVMSPYAAKVHCFLHYKRIPFVCRYTNPLRASRELPVGRQVPVVTIGDESRADSTPIGLWLDERFPDAPRLLPVSGDERERLLEIDDWISHHLIPSSFRFFPGDGLDLWRNGWRLSWVMTRTAVGGLPPLVRAGWPLLTRRVPFIRRLLAMANDGRSLSDSKKHVYGEFISHLEGGPFVAGRAEPSLPDFAAYPQFALYYLTAFRGSDDILAYPAIMAWLARMTPYVTGEPAMVPDVVRVRELPPAA